PSLPVKSMTDIVTLAKKEPGKLNIGTPPSPTLNYFGAEQFKSMTGADVVIVPYKGTGPLTTDLLGGHIKLAFNTLPPAIGNIKAGAIRAVAVAAPKRLAAIPDVPTTAEAGMPGLDIVQYYGLVAPAKTAAQIVERLNKELNKVLAMPDIQKRLIDDGGAAAPSTPAQYAANIKTEEGKWAALIKKLGLVVP
ncbi:MAG TPA: tripartite tricarboxylate transporter substrate-binding protein, partial [Pseudolabrys sp.]